MANSLHDDGMGASGLSVFAFCERTGLGVEYVTKLCRNGKIMGARKHCRTKKWWIYPPAKILCEKVQKRVNTSTPMNSTSRVSKQD